MKNHIITIAVKEASSREFLAQRISSGKEAVPLACSKRKKKRIWLVCCRKHGMASSNCDRAENATRPKN